MDPITSSSFSSFENRSSPGSKDSIFESSIVDPIVNPTTYQSRLGSNVKVPLLHKGVNVCGGSCFLKELG
jgi:hypothetical protein